MKPAPFEYRRASTTEEAVWLLAEAGEEARVLAGGQSLVLEMTFRRVRPTRLVDINPIGDLDLLSVEGDYLRIGALVRHKTFEESAVPGPLGGMLARACSHIAHPPIRTRGTMAGSLAYAHPSAEWGAVAVALDAELELLSPGGRRTVGASDFFRGPFATARGPDELLAEVRLPLPGGGTGAGFAEHRRTEASYALVAAVATLKLREGKIEEPKVGLAGAADRPLRALSAERSLSRANRHRRGCSPRPDAWRPRMSTRGPNRTAASPTGATPSPFSSAALWSRPSPPCRGKAREDRRDRQRPASRAGGGAAAHARRRLEGGFEPHRHAPRVRARRLRILHRARRG